MPFEAEAIRAWLAPRPVKILWGVGKKTSEVLVKYGYHTCADLQQADPRFLVRILGDAAAASIRAHAFGLDSTIVAHEEADEKSVSREHTFDVDESRRASVRAKLLELVTDVGRRVRTKPRWARTCRLKLRDAEFNTVTRQARFELPVCDDMTFRHQVLELFDREWPEWSCRSVRLVGFGVSDFVASPGGESPSLFPSPLEAQRAKREKLAAVLDALAQRHQRHT